MGLFDSKQTQTNAPWKPAQSYILKGMRTANDLLKAGAGFKAPGFQTWAPMSSRTKAGLGSIWANAQGGNPLAGQSANAISGILGGPESNRYDTLYNKTNALAGAENDKYNKLYGQVDNPHWAEAVQNQSDLIANDVQRQFSGLGRVGSAADTGALVDQLGRYRTGALSEHWDANIANQRGILGDQASLNSQRASNLMGIAGGQVQGQLGAIAAAPGAYNQRFLPGQAMGQVGAAYDDLAARRLQAQIDKFNTGQQAPWNRLQAYNGAISGTGGGSGFGQQTVTKPFDWLGALAAAGKSAALSGL
jgi:hypothetical protein